MYWPKTEARCKSSKGGGGLNETERRRFPSRASIRSEGEIVAVSWITFDSIPVSCQDPFPFRPFSNWANIGEGARLGERGSHKCHRKRPFYGPSMPWLDSVDDIDRVEKRGWEKGALDVLLSTAIFPRGGFLAEVSQGMRAGRDVVSPSLELPYICNLNPSLFWLRPGWAGNWEMNTVRARCSTGDKWKYRVAILQLRV